MICPQNMLLFFVLCPDSLCNHGGFIQLTLFLWFSSPVGFNKIFCGPVVLNGFIFFVWFPKIFVYALFSSCLEFSKLHLTMHDVGLFWSLSPLSFIVRLSRKACIVPFICPLYIFIPSLLSYSLNCTPLLCSSNLAFHSFFLFLS